jgi:BlaI family penicillinase repressor
MQRLTARQTAIMQVLWDRGEASVADVQHQLASSEEPLAYSTIATLLARLEKRGLVRHRSEGRTFLYQPALSQERASSNVVGELLGRFFGGRPSALVNHLLEHEDVDVAELEKIKAMLAAHERAGSRSRRRK